MQIDRVPLCSCEFSEKATSILQMLLFANTVRTTVAFTLAYCGILTDNHGPYRLLLIMVEYIGSVHVLFKIQEQQRQLEFIIFLSACVSYLWKKIDSIFFC